MCGLAGYMDLTARERTEPALPDAMMPTAILKHPRVSRNVDLIGLDQIVCFPGLISPRTMFQGIEALPPGRCLIVAAETVSVKRCWDLDYPTDGGSPAQSLDDHFGDCLSHPTQGRLLS